MALDYDDGYDEPIDAPRRRESRHSGFGIASFVIAILVGIAEFILLVVAGVMEAKTPGGMDEDAPATIILGSLLIGGLLMSFVGAVLAIAGLVQGGRSKVFPVLGLGFNGMIILGVIGIIIIGLLIGD
jgi:hypothetical protein